MAVKNLALTISRNQIFSICNQIAKYLIYHLLSSQPMTHPQLMLIVYLQISAQVTADMYLHLQGSINGRQLFWSTIRFVIEFALHLTGL
jgi:hypothetical protein